MTVLAAGLAALVLAGCGQKGPDPDEVPVAPAGAQSRVSVKGGVATVKLNPDEVRAADIDVGGVDAVTRRPERPAFGVVVDPQTLAASVTAISDARSQLAKSSASLAASEAEKDRTGLLRRNGGNISEKDFETARAAWLSDQAAVAAAKTTAAMARTTATLQWGPVVAGWMENGGGDYDAVVAGKKVLVRVALPGEALLRPPAEMRVHLPGGAWVEAALVSATPTATPEFQSAGAWYLAPAGGGLLPGMNAEALLPGEGAQSMVDVPAAAAVHWQGRLWVYEAPAAGTYFRREIPADEPDGQGGFYVPESALAARTNIVVRGAAILLSEEFKPAVADTD